MIKRIKVLKHHKHGIVELWSALLLISLGVYILHSPTKQLIQRSLWVGFDQVFPDRLWLFLFLGCGGLQLIALSKKSLCMRAASAFLASFVFLWGALNFMCYAYQWHFSLLAWILFAVINLYALARLTSVVREQL